MRTKPPKPKAPAPPAEPPAAEPVAEAPPQRHTKYGKPIPEGALETPTGGFLTPGRTGKPGVKEKRRRMIREVFEEVLEYDMDGVTQLAAGFIPPHWPYDGPPSMAFIFAAQQILSAGTKGSPTEIYNRLEGPVTQKTEITGPGGSPVVLQTYLPPPAAAMKKTEG